jgi:hypothetical protein
VGVAANGLERLLPCTELNTADPGIEVWIKVADSRKEQKRKPKQKSDERGEAGHQEYAIGARTPGTMGERWWRRRGGEEEERSRLAMRRRLRNENLGGWVAGKRSRLSG